MRAFQAQMEVETDSLLGEGPLWDEAGDRLLWLDIPAQTLHSLAGDGSHKKWALDRLTSCVVSTDAGRLLAAGDGVVRFINPVGLSLSELAYLPMEEGIRTNDGACDPHGRLWIGTADRVPDRARGALYQIDGEGNVDTLRTGLTMSNGIDWSPDGRLAYHVDTGPRRVDRLELNATGDIMAIDTFLRTKKMPDGLTVDEEGGVWIAFWDGSVVNRYTADGVLDRTVHVAAGRVTSCAFGPSPTRRLYITTAREGMTDQELSTHPASGSLFSVDAAVSGQGTKVFAE